MKFFFAAALITLPAQLHAEATGGYNFGPSSEEMVFIISIIGSLVAGLLGSKLVSKLHPTLAYKSLFKTIFGIAGGVVGLLLLTNMLDDTGYRPDAIAIQITVLLIAAVLGGYISTLLLSLLVKGSKR